MLLLSNFEVVIVEWINLTQTMDKIYTYKIVMQQITKFTLQVRSNVVLSTRYLYVVRVHNVHGGLYHRLVHVHGAVRRTTTIS